MPSLAEKIETDAQAKLVLPDNRQPSDELGRYKAFLKAENQKMEVLHREGGRGREVCQAGATLLDVLLRHILEPVKARLVEQNVPLPKFSLVAIGGYGRGELN